MGGGVRCSGARVSRLLLKITGWSLSEENAVVLWRLIRPYIFSFMWQRRQHSHGTEREEDTLTARGREREEGGGEDRESGREGD